MNSGLNNPAIASLLIRGSELFAGTGNGIWSRPLSDFSRKDQSISFTAIADKTFGDPAFILNATSNSGLPVSYTSSNASVATVSGNSVTILGAGEATITASQGGNESFNAATEVQQVLTVNKAVLTASVDNKTKTFGDPNPPLTFTYSGFKDSDNPSVIDVPPSITTIATPTSNVGTYPITLTGGNDNNYLITASNGTLTVTAKDQLISFPSVADKTEGAASFNLSATASSGLIVTYESVNTGKVTLSGNLVTIVAPGIATIRAKQPGNNNFKPAPNVERTFCVRPAKPSITLNSSNPISPILTSNTANGNQWFLNGTALAGATGPSLSVTQSGAYTLQVTVEGCVSDISDQQAIVITGDIANGTKLLLTIYPNPTNDKLYVSLQGFKQGIEA